MPKETVECDACGGEIRRKPSQINDTHNFCDRDCRADWQTVHQTGENHPNYTQKLIECDWCGDTLSRPKWRREQYEHQFCDKDCKGNFYAANPAELHEHDRVEVECETCGEQLERRQHRIEQNDVHFCSLECKGEWWSDQTSGADHVLWKGGCRSWYGENWDEQRRKARKRDGYRCWFCGTTDGASQLIRGRELDVHHVKRKDDFDDLQEANRVRNLLTVCQWCHSRIFQ